MVFCVSLSELQTRTFMSGRAFFSNRPEGKRYSMLLCGGERERRKKKKEKEINKRRKKKKKKKKMAV